jgi:hypothetical protein
MYSSPVRRFTNVLLRLLARLACIRRAASVHSEPGSNSHKGVLRIWTKGHHFNTLTPLASSTFSIQLSKNKNTRHASRALYSVHRKRVKGPFYQTMAGYSLQPHALTALSHAANRQEARAPSNTREDNKASDEESSCICVYNKNRWHDTNHPCRCGGELF